MIRLSHILLLTVLYSFTLMGQMADPPVRLSGVVNDENGQPIPGARVFVNANQETATITDNFGRFTFNRLAQGQQVLIIYSLGFEPITDTLFCNKNNEQKVVYTLLPMQQSLGEVLIKADRPEMLERLRSIRGTILFAAKKNDIIRPDLMIANKGSNNARQIYAKVSGLNIWESDYGGNQLEIGGRGLSPSRTSNFNTRQDGYDISADPLGYPETYYTPPADAIEQIDITRGAASLQYGSQFGGLVNFKLKDKTGDGWISGESKQTVGSFGLVNSFNAIGLEKGKHKFYGFANLKVAEGWKDFSSSKNHTLYGKYTWQAHKNLELAFAYTSNAYLAQQPGGLTDGQFAEDMYQVTRKRNWFNVNWRLPSVNVSWKINEKTKLNHKTFGLIAERKALGFLQAPNRIDPAEITGSTEAAKQRNLISDQFNNLGTETRILRRTRLLNKELALTTGFRFYRGNNIKQQGAGSTGDQADFNFVSEDFPGISDFNFKNTNTALFSEALYYVAKNTSVTAGLRWENINTGGIGEVREVLNAGSLVLRDSIYQQEFAKNRNFAILGFGVAHRLKPTLELFANFSQNYRSITFNDVVVKNPSFRVDPNIEDERGFNLDLGLKGLLAPGVGIDVTAFYLKYANRIGLLFQEDPENFQVYRLRTNIGQSNTYGIEGLVEINPLDWFENESEYNFSGFLNISILKGRYKSDDPVIDGNKIELVPDFTLRTGIKAGYKDFSLSVQYSYVNDHFSDSQNSFNEVPNGISGLIPTYRLWDAGVKYSYKSWSLESGVNNLTNTKYFTRRATGYPGPGIIPANPRNYYVTLGFVF